MVDLAKHFVEISFSALQREAHTQILFGGYMGVPSGLKGSAWMADGLSAGTVQGGCLVSNPFQNKLTSLWPFYPGTIFRIVPTH